MSTIRDVAKHSGVSIATVSRVLNNDDSFVVTKETKDKIFSAIKKLNYEKKKRKSKKFRLQVSIIKSFDDKIESEDVYYMSLKRNLENTLKKNELNSKIFKLSDIINDKHNDNKDVLFNLTISKAVIIIGEIREEELLFLKKINKNIVCVDVDNTDNDVDYITFDTKIAVDMVIKYLQNLGHKKIGLLVGRSQGVSNLVDFREKFFREIMLKNAIYTEKELEEYIKIGVFSAESGYDMMMELLKITDSELPTAVFCGNDSIAMGAYKAIREKKLKVPENISIVGFNDLKVAQYMIPPLTTVKIDTKIISIETVNLVLELINKKRDYKKKVYLPFELVERESCLKIIEE